MKVIQGKNRGNQEASKYNYRLIPIITKCAFLGSKWQTKPEKAIWHQYKSVGN